LLDQLELPTGFWQRFIPRSAHRLPAYERIRAGLEVIGGDQGSRVRLGATAMP
jgi:hypothetical protein